MKIFGRQFNVQNKAEIVVGLGLDSDSGLRAARERLHTERQADEQAQRRLLEANTAVSDMQAAVVAGQQRPDRLTAALTARTAAALLAPPHEAKVREAEQAVDLAIVEARARVVAEADRRRDTLQKIADEVAPILQALKDAEVALDAAVHAVVPGRTVAALTWPQSVEDECAQRNSAFSAANFAVGAR